MNTITINCIIIYALIRRTQLGEKCNIPVTVRKEFLEGKKKKLTCQYLKKIENNFLTNKTKLFCVENMMYNNENLRQDLDTQLL